MSHKMFFKFFDGSQNIFLCSIFVILFLTLWKLEHKLSKLSIRDIEERKDMLNKSHALSRYRANSGKIKRNVRCILNLMLGSLSLSIDKGWNFKTSFLP